MSINWEKVIPQAIPMKRAPSKKMLTNDIMPVYTRNIYDEAKKTSQKFREKIEVDLKKCGIK